MRLSDGCPDASIFMCLKIHFQKKGLWYNTFKIMVSGKRFIGELRFEG